MAARKKRTTQKSGIASPEAAVSREFIARILGVDVRSLKNFVDEGMPKAERGRYPLLVCVQWYLERERAASRSGKGLNDLDLARQRKTIAEARLAEINLSEKESRSVPIEVHEQRLRDRLASVAGEVKAIGRYNPDVVSATTPEAADALLDRMADEILRELAGLSESIE